MMWLKVSLEMALNGGFDQKQEKNQSISTLLSSFLLMLCCVSPHFEKKNLKKKTISHESLLPR